MAVDYEALKENFIDSSLEFIEKAEKSILLVEENYSHRLIDEVFQCVHSIKGASGMFDLDDIFELSHSLESYLSFFSEKKIKPEKNATGLILQGIDRLCSLVENIKINRKIEYKDLINEFSIALNGSVSNGHNNGNHKQNFLADKIMPQGLEDPLFKIKIPKAFVQQAEQEGRNLFYARFELSIQAFVSLSALQQYLDSIGEKNTILQKGIVEEYKLATDDLNSLPYYIIFLSDQTAEKIPKLLEDIQLKRLVPIINKEEVLIETMGVNSTDTQSDEVTKPKHRILKVHTQFLDKLITITEEIVLVRNAFLGKIGTNDTEINTTATHLASLVTSLQENIYRMRLQNMDILFQKLFRVLRDACRTSGKNVKLVTDANQVELDKSVLDMIESPLVHIVRNAVDHGIESKERRLKSKKPIEGSILVSAKIHGSQIVVSVHDDGGGLNIEKIKETALSKKLVTLEKAKIMPDQEAMDFIFHPGFSTASKVSKLSGRGVGMDMARSQLNRIGGSVRVASSSAKGTLFHIVLPQTISIHPCLVLQNKDNYFAIFEQDIQEIVKVEKKNIQYKNNQIAYKLRDVDLPIVSIDRICGDNDDDIASFDEAFIISIKSEGIRFGILSRGLLDKEHLVIKKLGKHFQSISEYVGAAILSMGSIVLILNIFYILEKHLSSSHERRLIEKSEKRKEHHGNHTFVIFQIGKQNLAFYSQDIIKMEKIEYTRNLSLVKKQFFEFQNEIIPLVNVREVINPNFPASKPPSYLIFVKIKQQTYALLTEDIVHIGHHKVKLSKGRGKNKFLIGKFVLEGHDTFLVDLHKISEAFVNMSKAS